MICTHCKQPIGMREEFDRLDAGVRLSDGTNIARDVNLHASPCSALWWAQHYPWLVSIKTYERGVA